MALLNFLRMVQDLNHILEYRFLCQNSPKKDGYFPAFKVNDIHDLGRGMICNNTLLRFGVPTNTQPYTQSLPEIGTCSKANFQIKPTL